MERRQRAGTGNRSERSPTADELHRWAQATGVVAAIRHACRVDDSVLCAVGDHGLILLSRDAGRSWQAVRGEKRRTAILFVANEPTSVPWSLLGSEAMEERFRVSLLLREPSTPTDNGETPSIELANQIVVMLGGSGADRIASKDTDLGQVASQWINVHRPAAVVLDQSLPAELRDAFFHAATSAGVLRVAEYAFDGAGRTTLHRDALLPNSGVLASDLLADAMHYLAPLRQRSSSVTVRYTYDTAPAARLGKSIASGLPLPTGHSLATPPKQASRRLLQIVHARVNQSERIAKLIRSSRTTNQFAESLQTILDQTAKEDQFRLAWSILGKTRSPGATAHGHSMHLTALDQIASRFPATSAGRWAALRREAIGHSLEWKKLSWGVSDSMVQTAGASLAETVPVSPFQVASSGIQQASMISPVVVPKPEIRDLNKKRDAKTDVDLVWEFHPLVLFSREAIRLQGEEGQPLPTEGTSANLQRLADATHGPWSALLRRGSSQVVVARRASRPPRLDGIMDDDCWHPTSSTAPSSSRLRMAYDHDYVYVAVQCGDGELRPDTQTARSSATVRDHDLTNVDRLRLSIDTDRDLMTELQLQVSDGPRTCDAIDGHHNWQPTWYVDTRRADGQVTIEMAILRRDLVELPITPGESWFLSAAPVRAGRPERDGVMPTPSDWTRIIFQD